MVGQVPKQTGRSVRTTKWEHHFVCSLNHGTVNGAAMKPILACPLIKWTLLRHSSLVLLPSSVPTDVWPLPLLVNMLTFLTAENSTSRDGNHCSFTFYSPLHGSTLACSTELQILKILSWGRPSTLKIDLAFSLSYRTKDKDTERTGKHSFIKRVITEPSRSVN